MKSSDNLKHFCFQKGASQCGIYKEVKPKILDINSV